MCNYAVEAAVGRLVPADHRLHELALYLARLQAGRKFPRPREFDILACRRYAGWLHLLDVTEPAGRRDYVFAVYASRITDITGRDYQSRSVNEITDDARRIHFREVLERVISSRSPEYMRDRTRGLIKVAGSYEFDRLVWPMSTDGESIDRVLIAIQPI